MKAREGLKRSCQILLVSSIFKEYFKRKKYGRYDTLKRPTLKVHFIKSLHSLNNFINGLMCNPIFWWGYNSQALVNK